MFLMEMERKAEHEVNLLRPPALLHWDGCGGGEQPQPLDERRRIVQRWIEYENRKGPRHFDYVSGEISDCIARPHVRIALNYYNFNHPGAEFDCVRPLSAYFASFRGQIWSHVNFLARRRGCIDAPVLRFFAELFYYGRLAETPVVVSCTILREEPLFVVRRREEALQEPILHLTKKSETDQEPLDQYRSSNNHSLEQLITEEPLFVRRIETVQEPLVQYRSSCAFCTDRYEILHPSEDEFVCGKEGQGVESSWWFYLMMDEMVFNLILPTPRCFLMISANFVPLYFMYFHMA
ncbi:uncharacterized protein LOC127763061 [Oryza glaberrima]|uniref:uncharacterized protein LOC127763061 n=1 Tax=Oryza glaberrima TaxID=4538 RepID=UPI00224C17B7|nr:uncharacterized protein LOC127763061 [Oryza glaberrima]